MDEPISLTELKAAIREEKLRTFEYMRGVSILSRADLDNAGYRGKSAAEAIKMILDETVAGIERKVQRWERENP